MNDQTHNSLSIIPEVGLTEIDGQPRARDIDIGERLGFDRPRDIRKLIERNLTEIESFGVCATVARPASPTGGRPTSEYWLNEEQVLLISSLSDAPNAPAVRAMLIRVFVAWRRGHLVTTDNTRLEHDVAELRLVVTNLVIAHDAHRAVLEYVSVRQMLDEAKALTKGRNSLNRRFGSDLRRRALLDATRDAPPARKCPHSGVWLYQRDFASRFMKERGVSLVADHNATVLGQGVIKFPGRRAG